MTSLPVSGIGGGLVLSPKHVLTPHNDDKPRPIFQLTAPAKLANPAPLGLSGFGVTTVVLSAINAGWMGAETVPVVIPLAFAYGGVAQLIAGYLEFQTGNTFGMLAFTSYGCFWWWYAFLKWTIGGGLMAAPPGYAVGTVLLGWGFFTFMLWVASFRLNKMVWSIFALLWVTFLLLGVGDCTGMSQFSKAGGYLGFVCGMDALITAGFEVVNAVAGKPVISLGTPFVVDPPQ